MRPYLLALYDPTPSRVLDDRGRSQEDPLELFQLASAGLFDVLFATQRREPWQDEGRGDIASVSPLASALVDYVTGEGLSSGLTEIEGDDGEATAAAIIASVQLADAGRTSDACDGLRAFLERLSDDLHSDRAAIQVHLGLRAAELGVWEEAMARTEEAVGMCEAAGFEDSSVAGERVLHYIARQNQFTFDQYGRGRVVFSPRGPRRSFPDSVMINVAEGLDRWMDGDFKAAFADPDQRSVTFSSGDQAERSFLAAVVRAELIGSWHSRRAARRSLGRYSLRRVIGKSRGDVATGIATLVEAEDTKGLALATRHFRRYGPLAGVAEVAASLVAERPWGPTRVSSSVAVLRESVELLTEQAAVELAERLAEDFDLLRYPTRMTDLTAELLSLAAQIARHWRNDKIHATIADALLAWLAESDDAPLQQRAVSVVRAVDWAAVPTTTVEGWRRHAVSHLDGDLGFASRAFLEASVDLGEPAHQALREAYTNTGDLGLGFILLQVGGLDQDGSTRLVNEATRWVTERTAEAASGVFGMYADDEALVLAVAATRGLAAAWAPLIGFLRNPVVPLAYKERSLRHLRDHVGELPVDWRNEIAAAGEDLAKGSDVLFDAPTTIIDTAALRLAAGGLSADETRSEVIRAATSADDSQRAAAAQLLVDARKVVGLEATTMTLLLLTRDRHPKVRAEAGRYLSRVAHDSDPDLGTRRRLLEMLREPGTAVPSAVLFGIQEEGLRFADLLAPCTALAKEHLSVEVRALAQAVVLLQAPGEDTAAHLS